MNTISNNVKKWGSNIATIGIACMVAGCLAFSVNAGNSTQMQGASALTMNIACGNSLSIGKHFTPSGVDSVRAEAIVAQHPELLRDVCGKLNAAVLNTLADPAHPTSSATIPNAKADNSAIHHLAGTLGIDRASAEKIVAHNIQQPGPLFMGESAQVGAQHASYGGPSM